MKPSVSRNEIIISFPDLNIASIFFKNLGLRHQCLKKLQVMNSNSPINRNNRDGILDNEDYERPENSTKRRYGTLEEIIDEHQSGEIVGQLGFVPIKFIDDYLFRERNESNNDKATKIAEIVEKIVDRVIVTSPSEIDGSTVQMKLVQNVFEGSEVWIKRDKGDYEVEFKTSSNEVTEFLEKKKLDLQERLEKNLSVNVNVTVSRNKFFDNVNKQI